MSGFTYNGIHCSEFNIEYIPNAQDRWFPEGEFQIYSKDIDWRHGGYYFGNKVNIRKINLKCYFEEITIKQREKIRRWLGRNTSGKLIFDDMPFMYFDVRPEAIIPGEIYNDTKRFSGTFTIPFVAHKPFGYLMRKYNTRANKDHAEDYCGIIPLEWMPAEPGVNSRNFMVYNPGTEVCGMTIRISGSAGKPIMFSNTINGTSCVIRALPTNNLVLDINGETGRAVTYVSSNPSNFDNGYAYHDRGMVRLEPNSTQVHVRYTNAGTSGTAKLINIKGGTGSVGDRVLFDNAPALTGEVIAVSADNTQLTCLITGGTLPSGGECKISSVNRIQILEEGNNNTWVTPTQLTLQSISIDYQPKLL